MSTPGEIPQSQALAEAGVDSLAELMSRDPEGYSRQDLSRVVLALREQRERLAKAEVEGGGARKRAVPKISQTSLKTSADIGDLDL